MHTSVHKGKATKGRSNEVRYVRKVWDVNIDVLHDVLLCKFGH